jgi:hypothetical protein
MRDLTRRVDQPVRGLLITGRPLSAVLDTDTLEALAGLSEEFEIDWFWYDTNLSLNQLR